MSLTLPSTALSIALAFTLAAGLAPGKGIAHAVDRHELETHARTYSAEGRAVMEAILSQRIEQAAAATRLREMVKHAVWVAKAYAEAFPEGKRVLSAATEAAPTMEKLSFKQLEEEWHDLGFFSKPGNSPGIDLKDEDHEHFTDPLHCIVHPLLTLKALDAWKTTKASADLQSAKEELAEGLEQMEKTKAALLRK